MSLRTCDLRDPTALLPKPAGDGRLAHRCHLLSIAAKGYPPDFLPAEAEAPSATLVWAGGSARAGPAVAAAVPLLAACVAEGGRKAPEAPLLELVLPLLLLLAARRAMRA